ncbi:hypothetical protein WA158_004495 [Blastocystis sp. Blastoise]
MNRFINLILPSDPYVVPVYTSKGDHIGKFEFKELKRNSLLNFVKRRCVDDNIPDANYFFRINFLPKQDDDLTEEEYFEIHSNKESMDLDVFLMLPNYEDYYSKISIIIVGSPHVYECIVSIEDEIVGVLPLLASYRLGDLQNALCELFKNDTVVLSNMRVTMTDQDGKLISLFSKSNSLLEPLRSNSFLASLKVNLDTIQIYLDDPSMIQRTKKSLEPICSL